MSDDYAWAHELASAQAWVLHVPTRVVGRVTKFELLETHASREGKLYLEEGHSFWAVRDKFVRLSEKDVFAHRQIVEVVRTVTLELATYAKSQGVARELFTSLVASALQAQANALVRAAAAEKSG